MEALDHAIAVLEKAGEQQKVLVRDILKYLQDLSDIYGDIN